jgi:hypothetical protein
MLATLQLALRSPSSSSSSSSSSSALATAALQGGRNTAGLRAQGKLCITFALRHQRGTDEEKMRVAAELERRVDSHAFGGEYRRCVYRLGGRLEEEDDRDVAELVMVGGALLGLAKEVEVAMRRRE